MISLANLSNGSVAWLLLQSSEYDISLTGDFSSSGTVRLDHRHRSDWKAVWSCSRDAEVRIGLGFGEYLIVVDGPGRVFVNIKPDLPAGQCWMPRRPLLLSGPAAA